MIRPRTLLMAMAIALSLPALLVAAPKKLICWTTETGQRSCGDAVPPQYSDSRKTVFSPKTNTRKVIPGAKSKEQLAQEEEAQKEAREIEAIRLEQAAYDRALIKAYVRPQEIAELRDYRLETMDGQIVVAESAIVTELEGLKMLESRLPPPEDNRPAPEELLDKIDKFEDELARKKRALSQLREKRDATCTIMTRDIQRYQIIKTGQIVYEKPCPPPPKSKLAGY